MAFLDTLFVNGHDVRALSGLTIVGSMELFAPGEFRGDPIELAGRDGAVGQALPRAKYILHVPIRVAGATRGERNDNLRALGPLLRGTTGLVPLKRRIATGSADAYAEHTANGSYISGLSMSIMNPNTGATELQFYNLSGAWWDGSQWLVP